MSFPSLRHLNAGNEGPFTLDGTRTYVVGRSRVAVIDPGPDLDPHLHALLRLLGEPQRLTVLLTHGHSDHAGVAERLLTATGATVLGAGVAPARPVADGESIRTDAGSLVALHTPGHTADHLSFHWPEARTLFVGDLLLGQGSTTWVAGYRGCIADYFRSLDRIQALDVDRLVPTHGPPLEDPQEAIDRFRNHRALRIEQVEEALGDRPDLDTEGLLDRVYGSKLPASLRPAASASLEAIREHLAHRASPDGR